MIYEANASSSACRLWRVSQVETSTPQQHRDCPADPPLRQGTNESLETRRIGEPFDQTLAPDYLVLRLLIMSCSPEPCPTPADRLRRPVPGRSARTRVGLEASARCPAGCDRNER